MPQNCNNNSSTYSFPEPKAHQHLRLTLDDVVEQYQKKLIKATTLVYYAVKIYRQDGHKLQLKDVDAFCQRLSINRSTFYKAVNKLEEADIGFHWQPIKGITLWIEESPSESRQSPDENTESPLGDNQSPLGDNQSPLGDKLSPLGDNQSPLGDKLSPLGDKLSPLGDKLSPLGDKETSKPASDKDSRPSSNIYSNISQISINSLSKEERENFEKFVREEYRKSSRCEIKEFVAFVRPPHFQEWWDKFIRATNRVNWESHPKFPEWLAHIKAEGHQIFILFGDSTLPRKDRERLVEWVKVKGLLEVPA